MPPFNNISFIESDVPPNLIPANTEIITVSSLDAQTGKIITVKGFYCKSTDVFTIQEIDYGEAKCLNAS